MGVVSGHWLKVLMCALLITGCYSSPLDLDVSCPREVQINGWLEACFSVVFLFIPGKGRRKKM